MNFIKIFTLALSFISTCFSMPLKNEVVIANAASETSLVSELNKLEIDTSFANLEESDFTFVTLTQQFTSRYSTELNTYCYLFEAPWDNENNGSNKQLKIQLSTVIFNDANSTEQFKYYYLTQVGTDLNGNLRKYRIDGLKNSRDTYRRFNISKIYNDARYYDVDKIYGFSGLSENTLEGNVSYEKVITITDKVVVDCCFGTSLSFFGKQTGLLSPGNTYNDGWFIFFNTDIKMDVLLGAKVTARRYNYDLPQTEGTTNMEDSITYDFARDLLNNLPVGYSSFSDDFYVNLRDQEIFDIAPGSTEVSAYTKFWWGGGKTIYRSYENIMDLSELNKQSNDFIFKDYVNDYSWGLMFSNTTRKMEVLAESSTRTLYEVVGSGYMNVAILELTFLKNGIVYTLPALDTAADDFTTITDDVSIIEVIFGDSSDWLKRLTALLGMILLIVGIILAVYLLVKIIARILNKPKVTVKVDDKNKKRKRRR